MSDLTKVSIDHDAIRRWAEERGGVPAHVKGTGASDDPGVLRIEFPGYGKDEKLEPISWDEWFRKFDEQNLAFIYEERKADGEMSTFNKLVSRETVKDRLEKDAKERASDTHGHSSSHGRSSGGESRTTGVGKK